MTDFKSYFEAGVESAKFAAEQKAEIYSVINSVNDQLREAYDNKVIFSVRGLQKRIYKNKSKNIFATLTDLNYDIEDYSALCISDSEKKNPIELAGWGISENGYPCTIKYEDREAYCYDKADLITEIASLLSNVKTGKAILQQIENASPKK